MKANYENKKKDQTSEIALGNLYDMNKQMMEQEPPLSAELRRSAGQMLEEWLEKHFNQKYFMLLCAERKDYTLFNLDKTDTWARPDALRLRVAREDIFECLDNRGTLLAADLQEDGAWEFWIKDIAGECAAYYFFPYGAAVIEY